MAAEPENANAIAKIGTHGWGSEGLKVFVTTLAVGDDELYVVEVSRVKSDPTPTRRKTLRYLAQQASEHILEAGYDHLNRIEGKRSGER